MYKHYETSDDVFVDREEYIEWMDKALVDCKKKSVVLHLKGIGGIGKSSLIKQWIKTMEKTVRVDCEQYSTFYNRLNIIAKGAVLHGVNLQRFDVLWQIRQRFVEGVEPVKEEGREWAKDIVMAIPFIGSLATIGTAISAVGSKVTPKLKGRYSIVGKWLQERLGKNHIERLLEVLWKEPHHAEFLYLDALLEDINNRKDETPIVFLMDHFEYVDSDTAHWRYQGSKINEVELWSIFLCSLKNCVSVMAGRKPPFKREDLEFEENELTELDCESCEEMLDLQGVTDKKLQEKIISVAGGNPFVIDAICDMRNAGTIVLDDIESLRADTLEEVRLKTWRRLFNMVGDLQDIINRAGLLKFFNRNLMNIIAPPMTSDMWDRLLRLSFVNKRDDGTWVLHDLAQELILAELGPRVKNLTNEVSQLLEKSAHEDDDISLLGHALSVEALSSEEDAIAKTKTLIYRLLWRDSTKKAIQILSNIVFRTVHGRAEQKGLLGWAYDGITRYAEGEAELRDAIAVFEDWAMKDFDKYGSSLGLYLSRLGYIMIWTQKPDEANKYLTRAVEIRRRLAERDPEEHSEALAESLTMYGFVLANSFGQLEEAYALVKEAVDIFRKFDTYKRLGWALNILGATQTVPNGTVDYQRALEVQRELSSSDPENLFLNAIHASICHNLSRALYLEGRISEAEEIHNEGIAIRRELSALNPDAYEWRLALALDNYGEFLWRTRQLSKAGRWIDECLQISEKLMEKEPDAWMFRMIDILIDKACILTIFGRISEAESIINRAISLGREYVNQTGNSFSARRLLSTCLTLTSPFYAKTFRMIEAENNLNEAIEIRREYKDRFFPEEYLLGLALNNGGAQYLVMGNEFEARTSLDEATDLLEKQKDKFMLMSHNSFAISLSNLAILCKREGQMQKACELFEKSLSLFEEIVQKIPIRYQYDNTVVLNNFSILLKELDRPKVAESHLSKAIEIQRHFIKIEPQYFEPILALSLNNLGILYSEMNRLSQAEESLKEAIKIRRKLSKQTPEMYQVGLASSLHNYGVLQKKVGKSQEAKQSLRESLEIWEQLVTKIPEVINPRIARTLHHLRRSLLEKESQKDEVEELKLRISTLNFDFSEDEDLWIEEEEPLYIW
ncbi:MAG: tetratricopeptide repeat protein [Candidatus Thorarchaeota archaeon]